jgi:hypothetical protein
LAGPWAQLRSPEGETVHSFTMLTINADEHPFVRNFHKPQDEKRSVVICRLRGMTTGFRSVGERGEFLQVCSAKLRKV